MKLIDSHCHLQFKKYDNPLAVIERAQAVGVTKMVCVGTTLNDSREAIKLAAQNQAVWASVGIHPHDARDFQAADTQHLKKLLTQPKVVAVGEIGLDYYKNYSPPEQQKAAFVAQLETGLDSGLPYIFHVRDAWDDFWPLFDRYQNLRGVIHSFSAHQAQLDEILKRDLYVGLNGIMTFTNDPTHLAAAKAVPLQKLILETDAPFLTPKAYRGQICEPKHIRDIAQFLAELRGEAVDELATATTKNAEELFKV